MQKNSLKLLLGNEYEIKRTNAIENLLEKLSRGDIAKNSNNGIKPILFDKDEKELMTETNVEDIIIDRNANIVFVNEVLQIIESEFRTSKSQISRLIANASDIEKDIEKKIQLDIIKNNLEEDIQRIILKAKKEVPELAKVLEEQERKIYMQVEEILQEGKQAKENINSKEEFRNKLKQGVNVDEELALENAEKKREENIIDLPGNIIE